ncbi:hypothetical protein ABENE_07760 [Asticcacaulis benevestitus DSM 16100 = ATCC BAA-896]|uniref:Endonuclease n=2 Tax=Asticcacaulis TaxID=76890 RepID=V4RMM1_9CAUL|nr:hypothetical protein ABENE_07760 [Asticcacaulis benevestitus DSM 16100 = ATCC BAA-896]
MTVAAVAWNHLTPQAKARASALLKLNPNYAKWTTGVAAADRDRVAFLEAATFPDEMKDDPATYIKDGYTPSDPAAGDITGYADKHMHRGWHFINLPFSPDNTALKDPFGTNAVTQTRKALDILADATASDDAKSYSLTWVLHLVGDLHQPLHATNRLTQAIPGGDTGGNAQTACSDTRPKCGERDSLHGFWDGAVGNSTKVASLKILINRLPAASAADLQVTDPQAWAEESLELAKSVVYQPPVGDDKGPFKLTLGYRKAAGSLAEKRIGLAGERLAILLNARLS